MNDNDNLLTRLMFLGAFIGLGKLLAGDEPITWRLLLGRTILGSAASLVAGMALLHFDDIDELALVAIASALGIAGHTVIEAAAKRWLYNRNKGRDHETQ
ncbi:holin [Serratia marcescens]